MRRGRLFVVSGPSGAGKGTLVKGLMSRYPRLELSISATTRPPRTGEVDGRDYYFLTEEEFDRHLAQDDFLEWAEVYGHRYGTFSDQVRSRLEQGSDVILEIDVQGARQIKKKMAEAVAVFIYTPTVSDLEKRLRERSTESDEQIARRLRKAEWELEQRQDLFDYQVLNDRLEQAIDDLSAVYEAVSRA
jgi:guanylate kinase